MWHDVSMSHSILFVEDDGLLQRSVVRALLEFDFDVVPASSAEEGLALVKQRTFHTVVTDYFMPPGPSGIWLLENVMHLAPETRRILISGHQVTHAQNLLRMGVVQNFFKKPISVSDIVEQLRNLSSSDSLT